MSVTNNLPKVTTNLCVNFGPKSHEKVIRIFVLKSITMDYDKIPTNKSSKIKTIHVFVDKVITT
jgi:hypothetical protein